MTYELKVDDEQDVYFDIANNSLVVFRYGDILGVGKVTFTYKENKSVSMIAIEFICDYTIGIKTNLKIASNADLSLLQMSRVDIDMLESIFKCSVC